MLSATSNPDYTTHRSQSTPVPSMIEGIESDPAHHLTGPYLSQTSVALSLSYALRQTSALVRPHGSTASHKVSPALRKRRTSRSPGFWSDLSTGKWVVNPESSFKLMIIPPILYTTWQLFAPYFGQDLSNPFRPLLFVSHPVASSPPGDQRYEKGYLDLVLFAYHIVVWSFVRQFITVNVARRLGRMVGIKKAAKLDRFGEQFYAVVYFTFFATWGTSIMSQLPTWWYDTKHFWIGYPHWDMIPDLKRYYIMHAAYWSHQVIVMLLGLEKRRKDHRSLIAHHIVTLWLIGLSYMTNLTLIGHAVFLSMDVPDAVFATCKSLNYMRRETLKTFAFAGFIPVWIYFRVWLNIHILWSLWFEYNMDALPGDQWDPKQGRWLTVGMQYLLFVPLSMLFVMTLFWTFLIFRVAYRAVFASTLDDERSDDEDEANKEHEE